MVSSGAAAIVQPREHALGNARVVVRWALDASYAAAGTCDANLATCIDDLSSTNADRGTGTGTGSLGTCTSCGDESEDDRPVVVRKRWPRERGGGFASCVELDA